MTKKINNKHFYKKIKMRAMNRREKIEVKQTKFKK